MLSKSFFWALFVFISLQSFADPLQEQDLKVLQSLGLTAPREPARPSHLGVSSSVQERAFQKALSEVDLEQWEQAIQTLEKLTHTQPKSEAQLAGLLLLSEIFLIRGEASKAIDLLQAQEYFYPPTIDFYRHLSEAYLSIGALNKAQKALERALWIDPTHLNLLAQYEHLLVKTESWPQAQVIWKLYCTHRDELIQILTFKRSTPELILVILATLDRIRDPTLVPVLAQLLTYPRGDIAMAVLEIFYHTAATSSIPYLEKAAQSYEGDDRKIFERVLEALKNPDSLAADQVLVMPPPELLEWIAHEH